MTDVRVSARSVGDPERAWKALALVTDWVKHAESKAGATLAAAGIIGGVLYSLVKGQHHSSNAVLYAATTCGLLTLIAAFFSGVSLVPRIWQKEDSSNILYFNNIARNYPRPGGGSSYRQALHSLIADDQRLVDEIAHQVWVNSHVARIKFYWANLGVLTLLLAVIALAVTAFISAL